MPISDDALKAILRRLESAVGKPMSDVQNRRLCELLMPLDVHKASGIASDIERMENVPKNIVAVVLNAIDRIKENDSAKVFNANTWKAQELCTSTAEFETFFAILRLIMNIHDDDLIERNPVPAPCTDLDMWIDMGRPKTWSPIVDHFLSGYEKVYKNDTACLEFMKRYHASLIDRFYKSKQIQEPTQ